jgi:hypothetical protein
MGDGAIRQGRGTVPPQQERLRLGTVSKSWKVYALFNHDLRQIFVGASDAAMDALRATCIETAGEIEAWQRGTHRIECVEAVEEFPSLRHAKNYAQWLKREGEFEGAERYAMGLDVNLC